MEEEYKALAEQLSNLSHPQVLKAIGRLLRTDAEAFQSSVGLFEETARANRHNYTLRMEGLIDKVGQARGTKYRLKTHLRRPLSQLLKALSEITYGPVPAVECSLLRLCRALGLEAEESYGGVTVRGFCIYPGSKQGAYLLVSDSGEEEEMSLESLFSLLVGPLP